MTDKLEYLTVDTADKPVYGVIWLHGLGADCHDFEGLVPELNLLDKDVRFIFPNAPVRAVTINAGMQMRAWYDILEMSLDRKVDMENIHESAHQIEQLVEELAEQGISSDRVVLAGFSQGGVIAYQVALTGKYSFAGVMALSTYIADPEAVLDAVQSANASTPILLQHGSFDPVVDISLAKRANKLLLDKGYNAEFITYDMPHSVCPEQIKYMSHWLNQRFA